MEDLEAIKAYVLDNDELRERLGISRDDGLEVRPLGKGEHNDNYVFAVSGTSVSSSADAAEPASTHLDDGLEPSAPSAADAVASASTQVKSSARPKASGSADAAVPAGPTSGDDADGRRYVLRINRVPQPFHDNQVAYEYAALRVLEPSGCTPRALYVDDTPGALGKGVLVESFCPGEELDFDHLQPGDLQCAARLMADVHAVPVADDCPLFRPADPLRTLFDECVARYDVYRGTALEDPRYSAWIERFFAATREAMEAAPPYDGRGRIINTETLPSHFLLQPKAARAADAPGGAVTLAAAPATAATTGAHAEAADAPDCAATPTVAPVATLTAGARAEAQGLEQAAPGGAAGQGGLGDARGRLGYFLDWERPIVGEVAQDLGFFVAPSTTYWDSDYLFPREHIQSFVEDYWRAVDGRFERGTFDLRFEAYLRVSVLRSQTWFCKNAVRYAHGGTGHTVQRTFDKWGTYVSDEFNEMLWRECFS